MWSLGAVVLGLVLLTVGAELMVGSVLGVARWLRLPPAIGGLVLVAWGTSAPELATSVDAVRDGADAVAIGNVAGSNLFNIGVVLAVCALVRPLRVDALIGWRDAPLALLASGVVVVMGWDGTVSRIEGILLTVALIAYTVRIVWHARRDHQDDPTEVAPRPWRGLVGTAVGLGMLAVGARFLVGGSVELATVVGVDPRIVAVTVVAGGTSLPELFASLAATRQGELGLAVGNVVGSNLFNLLGVVGVAAIAAPDGIAIGAGRVDLLLATGMALLLVPIALTGLRVTRTEAAGLGGLYAGYLGWLAITA